MSTRSWHCARLNRLITCEQSSPGEPYKVSVFRKNGGPVTAGYVHKTMTGGRAGGAFRWAGTFNGGRAGVGRVDGSTLREVAEMLAGKIRFSGGE